MRTSPVIFFFFALSLAGMTQEIGYIETFSLSDDRAVALKELVPGTDDFYYFHALHAQNSGNRAVFAETMDRWRRERNGHVTDRARELLNRQALLDYEKTPQKTLDYLRGQLGLTFSHARKTGERVNTAPTVLDNTCLDVKRLVEQALKEDPRSLERITDEGLACVVGRELTGEQRRNLLSRLRRPDYPEIVALIAADLDTRDSRGFGSLPIHGLLTLAQMDELVRNKPALRNETAFVRAYLAKLAPPDEADLDTDPAAREAYYERVWSFVETLAPAHNSLKANALYNRLRHDLGQGVYNRERFLAYVKLPRDVVYLRTEFRTQIPRSDQFARLGEDFGLVALPPVPREEPLVRSLLLFFFKGDVDIEAFRPYFRDDFLKPLFAEAKIVNGIGDAQQWAPLLSPDAYRRLKERVDIDFAPDNPTVFGPDEPVTLTAFVKNVPVLLVKVYELNTFNYYRETGQTLNLAVNLDGLVATATRRVTYGDPSERRLPRTFELPELKGRGAYVVEFIGNGKSSRALVQKGRLNVLQEVTAAGHAFTVLDESGRRVADAEGWLGGRSFAADKEGRILVPFTAEPKNEALVVRSGTFASLVHVRHLAEQYALKAGVYVDREALIRRERAQLVVRPVLTVNGRPISLKLLENPRLVIRSVDLKGIATEKEIPDLVLREDAETVAEIQVPDQTVELSVVMKASLQNLSLGKKQDLADQAVFTLNGIERTSDIQSLHAGRDASGYYVDARGKNGEPLTGEPLTAFFKHRCLQKEIHVPLKTDGRGRAVLGPLADIDSFRVQASSGRELSWATPRNRCAYPSALHGRVGETLRVPFVGDPAQALAEVSLLEKRRDRFVKDWHAALAVADGFLQLRGLPAGDYSLWLAAEGVEIGVHVIKGEVRDGYVVSARRALELPRLAPLNVLSVVPDQEKVTIRLANASPYCRVHLVATRYLPAYDLVERIGFAGEPELVLQPWQPVRTFYESGRDIGDEYRYILDRQQADRYPGNMLERPGLLLNPWALRSTEAEDEQLAAGNDYGGRRAAAARTADLKCFDGAASGEAQEGYVGVDFLKQPAVAVLNIVPNKEGNIVIPRAALKGLPFLRVLAVDPIMAVMRCAALDDTPVETRELRLADGLAPQKNFAERKLVTPVAQGNAQTVNDVTTARFERYDTVAKAYRLLATLNADATFTEFGFVANWPGLDAKEQRRLYSKYACHELNVFLYHKDRAFFDAVIAPNLRNKKDKTYVDHWLLGDDLTGYLEPWRFGRLNAAERALLGKRVAPQTVSLARDARDRADLIPPDAEAFNRRFDTALQTGSLDAESVELAAVIDAVREKDAAEKQRSLSAFGAVAAEAAPAPSAMTAPAMEVAKGVKSPVMLKNVYGSTRNESLRGAERKAKAGLLDKDDLEVVLEDAPAKAFFDGKAEARASQRRFFQKLDQTQEWAENNYYHLAIEGQVAELVDDSAFWADYAAHDGKTPFLSKAFPETATSFTEMMLALAVLELPFKAGEHKEKVEGVGYTLTAASPMLLFHREILESRQAVAAGGVLLAQHVFRADDRERVENGERFDKPVTEEFLPHVVYGAQVVMTNPTGNRQKLHALVQIPMGAIPVNNGFYTRGSYWVLEPYSTRTLEYFFYFPSTGDYPQYPVTLASAGEAVGRAAPFTFHVVSKLSKVDTTSWAWLSQNGTEDEVMGFIGAANLHRIDLGEVAWRMRDVGSFKRVTRLLDARHVYSDVLWSYGVLHNDPGTIREFLRHNNFAKSCGIWLVSPLLVLDPVERFDYQHLEYAPLVNPRAHQVGSKRTILNARFREQYQRFMRVLSYKPKPDAADMLAVTYYLALQDRVGEALAWFGRIGRDAVPERLQADYMEAYLSFYTGKLEVARRLAEKHANEGVDRWRDRFAQVLAQLDEMGGGAVLTPDPEKRDQAHSVLAATEPTLELQVEAGRIRLDTRNIDKCLLNFYPMDIELLFSRNPFMQEGAAQFSFVRPAMSQEVAIPAGQNVAAVELPAMFKSKNVMVEALAGGVRRTQAYYANTLKVQLVESYGQLAVTHAETGKPLAGVYVKVYARMAGGASRFFKDGYTDLRGRFDYASLNTNELEESERLAILVLSDEFGAVVREAPPPKR